MKTLIFIPTYNERANVEPLFLALQGLNLNCDVLFVDDSSPDGTGKILDSLARKFKNVRALHRPAKLGIGGAHKLGIQWAYKNGYQILITMDADFTHAPAYIPGLLEHSENWDMVIGSRYLLKESLAGWNLIRKFLTRTTHMLTTRLLGFKYDSTGAFRLYRLDRVPEKIFELVESNGYSFFFESLYILNSGKYTICEIPINLPPRTYGNSKMSYLEALNSIRLLFAIASKASLRKRTFNVDNAIAKCSE